MHQVEQTREKGLTELTLKRPYTPAINLMPLGSKTVATSAQAMTVIGYGEALNVPFRNLHYKAACDNYQDLKTCIQFIDSYNEFDATLIIKEIERVFSLTRFYGADNSNTGNDLFKFEIAREFSPAIYIEFSDLFCPKIITERNGNIVHWQEFTTEDFISHMGTISKRILCDEYSIETNTHPFQGSGFRVTKARFWWD